MKSLVALQLIVLLLTGCSPAQNATHNTPISPEPVVETVHVNGIVTHTVTEFRMPEACIQALDLIESLAADVAKQIPATGGMTAREVDRLAQTAKEAMELYEPLAKACRRVRPHGGD